MLMGRGVWGRGQLWVHRFTMTMVKPLHHGGMKKQNTERARERGQLRRTSFPGMPWEPESDPVKSRCRRQCLCKDLAAATRHCQLPLPAQLLCTIGINLSPGC